jgi:hypothetical protein
MIMEAARRVNASPLVINDLSFVEMLRRGGGLENDNNIMIDDNYSSDNDDVPFKLPFDDIVPFP